MQTRATISNIVLMSVLIVLLGSVVGSGSQRAFVPIAYAQQPTLEVQSSTATPDFPASITFTLNATSNETEIHEVQLLYGLSREDSRTLVDAQFVAGKQIEAQHVLDTQVFHIPPGVEVAYSWIIRDAAGNELESVEQTIFYEDTRFNWQQRNLGKVTVYWYKGNKSFADTLIETAKTALDNLQTDIGAEVEEPVAIYIYANSQDMRAALQSNEVEWVGGQARPGIGLIIAAIAPGDTDEILRIIPHELSHQVLHQATKNPYGGVPLWFEEGLAVHNQQIHLDYDEFLLEEAARNNDLIPVEALAASFPTDSERASLSYAQSHSLVEFIIATYGTEAMHSLVKAFQAALPLDEALQETMSMTVDELDAAWRETLPAAERAAAATPTPQLIAPQDRFSGSLVSSDMPATDTPDQQDTNASSLPIGDDDETFTLPDMALPLWAELALGLGCCTVLLLFVGGGVLVVLRLMGIDKR